MRERRTMAEFRWIHVVLFLILMIHFTATVTGQYLYFTVRDGDDVTLPCGNVRDDQDECDRTDWIYNAPGHNTAELIIFGKIDKTKISQAKSDRLSVTENCSLVIKKVTDEDVGLYNCRQQDQYSQVDVSVVTITEHKDIKKVTLNCSVWTYEYCRHTVKWLFNSQVVEKGHSALKTSHSYCSASLTFDDSHFIYSSKKELLKCNVTHRITNKVQQFTVRPQSSGEKTGEDTKTTSSTIEKTTNPATNTTAAGGASTNGEVKWWWWLIAVIVCLAALTLIILLVERCQRRKGSKTQKDKKIGLSLNPAEPQSAPETSQDTTDPEDGVSYASVSFIKKTNSKVQVQRKDEGGDEGAAVTYSTVKTSSSAGASTDPSSLYAAIT